MKMTIQIEATSPVEALTLTRITNKWYYRKARLHFLGS